MHHRILTGLAPILALTFSAGAAFAAPTASPLIDVAQVSVGNAHSCALSTQGAVSCWGDNAIGQLGLGEVSDQTARPTAVPVPGLGGGVRAIVSGNFHTCAVTAERGVKCWGLNGEGAIGSGSSEYAVPTPTDVVGLGATVEAVAAGSEHSCALLTGGAVRCWGNNARGQLGDGTNTHRSTAVAVQGLPAAAVQLALAGEHSCAALANGEVRCWGYNESGQLGDGSTSDRRLPVAVQGLPSAVRAIGVSSRASCAITTAGALYCWGPQYPLAAFEGGSLVARAYPGFASGYTAIDGGSFHFCALRDDGTVKCLGDNADGQLGTGPIDDSLNAEFVVDLAAGVTALASGGWHNCARNSAGGLQCWGLNTDGQLGIDRVSLRLVPTPVSGLDSGMAAMAAGGFAGCALTSAGGVKCWGGNGNGEVGDGTTRVRLTARDVVGLGAGVRAIDAGDGSACALTADRTVKCWGANFDGRLGNGQTLNSSVPVDVVGIDGPVSEIGVGREYACAVTSAGGVRCWGSNQFGQLGTGNLDPRLTATPVSGLDSGVRSISTGYYHACAVMQSGGIKCWGVNSEGQLGNGSRSNSSLPVDVTGLSGNALAVSAGIIHTCALLQGGSVQCWGGAFFGLTLGDGSTEDRLEPVAIPALAQGVAQISVGSFHSCARFTDGSMRCWGTGGAIGDNTQAARGMPTPVAGLNSGVQQISAGFGGQSCAVINGAAKCWGANTFAQLGDGTTHGVPTAQTVLSNDIVRRVTPVTLDANAASTLPQFDASGRYVVFQSGATNLVDGDSNGVSDVFLRDRESGLVRRISLDTLGAQINGPAIEPSISADGSRVVFVAPDSAPAVLLGESKRQREARMKASSQGVFLRNIPAGTTQRIGTALVGSGSKPQIAPGGGSVVFTAPASASQGSSGQPNVFVVPLTSVGSGISIGTARCLSCKSVNADGSDSATNASGESRNPVISADGQWVAFQTVASNALASSSSPCPASSSQVLLRNISSGAVQRVSPPSSLASAQCGSSGSQKPSIDYSGSVVAFQSDQALSAGDLNARDDAYLWRSGAVALQRLSIGGNGADTAASAQSPQVSGDGKHVAFVSAASNHDLGFADNNDRIDLHAVALADPGTVLRLSRTATGAEADAASDTPVLNFDGSQLGFASTSQNLAAATGSLNRVFARSNPLSPAKRSATWWISSESGWGLTVFDQGNLLAPTWFTYDSDGEPTWFIVAGAFPQADGSFKGDLFRFTGTPFDQIQGPAARDITQAGDVSLSFVGDNVLQFDYRVGSLSQRKTLQRFPFGSRGFVCSAAPGQSRASSANYTDLWTGAGTDAGWGLTLFHVDDSVVAIWYTYDSDGEAVFFVITTTRQADGSFAGQVFRQRNGTPFSQINGSEPSAAADPVGTASFQFSDGQTASFSYVVNGFSQSKQINRLLVGNQASECRAETLP